MTGASIGRPRFVTVEEALAWHEVGLAQFGGSAGVRDQGLLESALAQAKQGFGGQFAHEFPFGMAAAYAFHLAKNHPFVDGNKRAALLCCGGFLRMNGWDLASRGEEAADAILKLVDGGYDKSSFAAWLEANARPRPSMELRDFFAALDPSLHFQHLQSVTVGDIGGTSATLTEARAAIPLIAHLEERALAMRARGDQRAADLFTGMFAMLVAIYRIAEDMGYEW